MSSSPASPESRPLLGPKPPKAVDHADDAHRRRVIAVAFTMVTLIDFAAFFLEAPQTSILERNICSRYYAGNGNGNSTALSDHDCTVAPVQAELATVNQMFNTFNRVPGFFVAIPLGIVADRYGRRLVIVFIALGALLQDIISKIILWYPDVFAPRLIWLASLANFVGGGDAVASSLSFLIVADVAPPHERAKLFFLLSACECVGELVALPLCALMMAAWDPWVPYLLYSVLTCIAFVITLALLPETLQKTHPDSTTETGTEAGPDPVSYHTAPDERPPAAVDGEQTSFIHSIIAKFRPLFKRNIIAIVLAFFVSAFGRQSTTFLLQYIRQRFNWSYERSSILLTLRAAVRLALLLVGLPLLNKLLIKHVTTTPGKDLFISRLSVAFMTLGSLVIAMAPLVSLAALGIVVFALGSGFSPAARSLATSFCEQDEAGLLYTALSITQTIGALIAGPLLSISFRWGLGLGREWTGIPFCLVAGLFACGFLAVSFVRL
ncbi:major facilitator superfamily domain-containing protein [Nemania sp. FL0916]|nr:major facilitator superfamily domain-containing protein [Nemania sp. FL0916]